MVVGGDLTLGSCPGLAKGLHVARDNQTSLRKEVHKLSKGPARWAADDILQALRILELTEYAPKRSDLTVDRIADYIARTPNPRAAPPPKKEPEEPRQNRTTSRAPAQEPRYTPPAWPTTRYRRPDPVESTVTWTRPTVPPGTPRPKVPPPTEADNRRAQGAQVILLAVFLALTVIAAYVVFHMRVS